jgi:hypothetical protein
VTARVGTPSSGGQSLTPEQRAEEILGEPYVLEGRLRQRKSPAPAAGQEVALLDVEDVEDHAPQSQTLVSANQRPLLTTPLTSDDMLSVMQKMRSACEAKKAFVVAQVLPIHRLHRPPGSRMLNGKQLPSLKAYEIREIFETYVTLHMDRRRYFNSTSVLPGIAIPFDRNTHELITDMRYVQRNFADMDFIIIGGSHSREAAYRLYLENPDRPEFSTMQCYIYVNVTEEEARQVCNLICFLIIYSLCECMSVSVSI